METLIERIKTQDSLAQFNSIPGRIFLDTNVLQYLLDFGEYIFEHYREGEEYFQARKRVQPRNRMRGNFTSGTMREVPGNRQGYG